MALADVAATPAPAFDARAAIAAVPRMYNFAADIIERNVAAGRADKPGVRRRLFKILDRAELSEREATLWTAFLRQIGKF